MRPPADDPFADFALKPAEARLLEGRKALVTGANSGLGEGISYELAAHGAAVAVTYVVDPDAADRIVGRINDAGGQAMATAMNVADEAAVQDAFAKANDAFGGLDLRVNNAGVEKPFDRIAMPLAEWQ
jgi:glucose 1-dehydrogenase